MKQYFTGILGQVRAQQKRFLRDKVSLFFTFLFPLFFLIVFGSIFGNQEVNFKVAIIDKAQTKFSKTFVERAKDDEDSSLKIVEVSGIDQAKEKMKRSEIDGIIELTEGFGQASADSAPKGTLKVLYQKGSDQSGQTLTAIMGQIIGGINRGMGQPEPPFKVESSAVGDEALKPFDYTFTGLLAFSLMSMGIFGLANSMPTEKQNGSYRRLRAAPFTAGQLIISTSIHYTLISLASVVSMLIVGLAMFKFNMTGSWLLFTGFTVLAALMTVGFGLLVGSWAKNDRQSAPISNLIAFPMMFLSGAFFPTFLFPEWLQSVSKFIPLSPVVDGLRLIMTESASLVEILPQIGALGLWILIVYALAIKLFRWE
ncbi:hypothetical protein CR969_00160 [Candidatus Saccharibacteria bacterium]|nr:MAG: hypothetical protein CR969_00160 [Candidatus Saccharibacteria bacterium]